MDGIFFRNKKRNKKVDYEEYKDVLIIPLLLE